MPYIKPEHYDRAAFDPETPGELNYAITMLIIDYMTVKGPSYQTINDILGALSGAKLEFVRQVVNPFEDHKIHENGGLYE